VNDTGDLLDDGNVSQVKDVGGSVIYSGSRGRQGTLEAWLGVTNVFTALMQPAGYEWNGTEKKWTKNPGKITHSVIEQAYKGNFHLLATIDGQERKFVIGKNKPEFSLIEQTGITNLTADQLVAMIEKYFKL